jgi:hypothetical protein
MNTALEVGRVTACDIAGITTAATLAAERGTGDA